MESRFAPLINVAHKLEVFLARRPVQIQLVVLASVVFGAFLATRLFWLWAMPFGTRWIEKIPGRTIRRLLSLCLASVRAVSFPVVCLTLLEPVRGYLELQLRLPGGLLAKTNWVLATLIAFRLVRTALDAALAPALAKRFQQRLLQPLFLSLLVLGTLANLTDLEDVYNIEITKVLGTVLKVGPLLLVTLGLYFYGGMLSLCEEVIHRFIDRQTKLDPGRSRATLTLTRYICLIIGVIVAISQFELDPSVVAAISGGLSIGVGFGLREILSNFISGFLLLFERSLNPGDVIEMDEQISKVEVLSVRATMVRTLNNEELVIPNQTFLTSSFKTYTGTDRTVRIPIIVQTDCHIELPNVIELLGETAKKHEDILKTPAPSVFVLEYGNNVATFQLNVWIADPLESPRLQSEVKTMVWEAFKEHNVALPFPEMDLHFPKSVPLSATVQSIGEN